MTYRYEDELVTLRRLDAAGRAAETGGEWAKAYWGTVAASLRRQAERSISSHESQGQAGG